VQQHLVALAVNLQLAGPLGDSDPAAAKALLEEMGRDVQQALSEAAQLAQRIYPPLLDGIGLAAALRSAAVSAGSSASVDVAKGASYPPEVAETIYLCYLDALEHATGTACTTVVVRDEDGAVAFEIGAALSDAGFDRLRDRVEALGGRLTIRSARLCGSLPVAR
jgi:signal transduction histidine kinase